MPQESKRQRFQKRFAQLKTQRDNWEDHWEDLRDYFKPWSGRFEGEQVNDKKEYSDSRILDNTGLLAARTLASGMMAGITSPARPWFKLQVPNPRLRDLPAVKMWLWEVEHEMRVLLSRSNVYNALHHLYGELGVYSTSAMLIVEDEQTVFRAIPMTVGQYYLATGPNGMVDTIYREFKRTVRQLVDEFGYDECSKSVQNQYDNNNLESWITVIHLIEPNDERDSDKIDNRNMAFRSVYYESNINEDKLLSESGFQEFAVVAPRWEVNGEDTYGNGPGSVALGDTKMLQTQQRTRAKAEAKMVDPPMNVPSNMKGKKYSIIPGAVNYVDVAQNGNSQAYAAHAVNLPIQYMIESIRETQGRITRAFYEDLFLMLANDNRSNVTAREIQEKHEEKLLMLGPVLNRLQTELLDPMIDRVFNIMLRQGAVPEPPEELQGTVISVEYISVLAQAQRLVGIAPIERMASFVGNLAQASPDALDKLNTDQAIDEYAEAVSAPPTIIRPQEEVDATRAKRAQMQQAQQAMEMGNQAAEGAKLLSETDSGGDNALGRMLRQIGL